MSIPATLERLRLWIEKERLAAIASTVLGTLVLPGLFGLLASAYTSAAPGSDARGPLLIALVAVGVAALVLGSLLILMQAKAPLEVVVEAVGAHHRAQLLDGELRRRVGAYAMVRAAFENLNNQTCSIDPRNAPDVEKFCEEALEKALEPILSQVTADISTVFGVVGALYTFEVHYLAAVIADPPAGDQDPRWHQLVPVVRAGIFGGSIP